MDHTIKNILLVFLFIVLFYLMKELSTLLIPLASAFLMALLIQPIVLKIKKSKFPNWLTFPVLIILSLGIIYLLSNILISTASEILMQKDFLYNKLILRLETILNLLGYNSYQNDGKSAEETLQNFLNPGKISSLASLIANSIGSFTGSFIMFALYYIFLVSGMSSYNQYILYVAGEKHNTALLENYEKIQSSIVSYIKYKSMVNLITATLVTIICYFFGIKFALFWGLLTLLFNFIPNIGSLFAVAFPLIMCLIQYDNIQVSFFFFICIAPTHFIMGNVIEPKLMSNNLRLNTVTVLFGLVFWGYIWGLSGMIMSIPLMVILKLILDHFKSLSMIGRIMGYPERKVVH